jgi:hypothetical protein
MITYSSPENKFLKACISPKYLKSGNNYRLLLVAWNEARISGTRYGSLNIRKNSIKKLTFKPSISVIRVIEGEHCLIIPEVLAGFDYAPFSKKDKIAITSDNGVLLSNNEISINQKSLNLGGGE